MWFALLKNPLTKIIAEKTFGAIKHKLEKDKIVRQKELDHVAKTDVLASFCLMISEMKLSLR